MPRIYVGNLAESVTREDLRALFSKIGRVGGALVITDKITGKSRGFGSSKWSKSRTQSTRRSISAAPNSKAARSTSIQGQQEPGAQKYRGERKRRAPIKRTTSNGTA